MMSTLMKKEDSILNLPEPVLDNILERLSPSELGSMSEASTSLMRRCRSNGLWDKQIQRKWGRLLGDVAYREWRFHMMRIINEESPSLEMNPNGLLGSFIGDWPLLSLSSYLENPKDLTNLLLSSYSSMALYISLQSGWFWFPAQVYKMEPRPKVSDALLRYDHISNTFQARCPTGEWQLIENNITWDRLRLSPDHISPCTLYMSNNNDLKPGDHIEIQKKRGSSAYDWYYGVIGHLESCDEDRNDHCSCEHNESRTKSIFTLTMSTPMDKEACLLKLPEPILDNIVERLSPNDLGSMSEVCTCLMRICRSNRLWDKHIQRRWGRLLGDVAYREWRSHVMRTVNEESPLLLQMNPSNGLLGSFVGVWPSLCLSSFLENPKDLSNLLVPNYSNMALYVSLQSGRFWFPAQVYQMEPRPRVYDALLSYNHTSNTFQARRPAGEWLLIETNITWDRLRLPPAHVSPCTTPYMSNNNDLKPGDHIEIQSKRGGLAYDWYYGVIGHLKSCDEDRNGHCSCKHSEMLVVMFKLQRGDRLRWKSVLLNRQVNKEQKFRLWKFGGIRKLESLEDIQSWDPEYLM